MSTQINRRFPEAGFVLVNVGTSNERRMLYTPLCTITRSQPRPNEPLVLSESNWGIVTKRERNQCRIALEKEYPNRKVIFETDTA